MPARAKLLYRDEKGRDASVDIPDAQPIFLGRGTDCAVRTDDQLVSRKNCRIYFASGRCLVEDLGSANGTFVNEVRVQKQALVHADVIRCGDLQVRYVEVAAPASLPKVAPSPSPAPNRTEEIDVGQIQQAVVESTAADLVAETEAALKNALVERDAALKKSEDLAVELESLRARVEANEQELGRLRKETFDGREELSRLKRDAARDKEELQAVNRRAEELLRGFEGAKAEALTAKARIEEVVEEMAARDRQLGRAHDEVQGAKKTVEELRQKLGELQKTKDEGWRELNAQQAQVEHLREVIAEQERILDERRVGLIHLESAAKDLRAEKEKLLRELVDARNQRDELREKEGRAAARIEALEEEQRRLTRAVSESGSASGEEAARLARELREQKVELKKLEHESARAVAERERLEVERNRAADDRARVDVERVQLLEDKEFAVAARARAEEAHARAESEKKALENDKGRAAAARDAALATAEHLQKALDRAQRRVAELELELRNAAASPAPAPVAAAGNGEMLDEQTQPALDVGALAAAHALDPALVAADSLRKKAQEVYEGINEALSELRTTIITAKGLFGEVGPMVADEDARRALAEALGSSMERTEDAKGLLRSLKDLAQG